MLKKDIESVQNYRSSNKDRRDKKFNSFQSVNSMAF